MKNLFAVILRYIKPVDEVDAKRDDHILFLQHHYNNKTFMVSGIQTPKTGGVILATSDSRQSLEKILQQDPFYLHGLAEYQIFEFTPTRHSPEFKTMLDKES